MQRIFRTTPRLPSFRNGPSGLDTTPKTADIAIFPAYSGKTSWSFVVDGPLNIGAFGEYTITPVRDIPVATKMWGAGGARGYAHVTSYGNLNSTAQQSPGGGGGYTTAIVILRAGVNYVIRVGQGGARSTSITPSTATYFAGGVGNAIGGTQGGGYTGIFKTSVTQPIALIMAGGGGGGGDTSYSDQRNAGGGLSGEIAISAQGGNGGTQLAGGSASLYNNAAPGGALFGGTAQNTASGPSMGGGGGGYFGGGGGNVGGGGGGSGRIGIDGDVSAGATTVGVSDAPANALDIDRNGAGRGGNAGGNTGADGRIILTIII